ncbi:MAG TPA: hypothetical protein VLM40_11130, partial [Gemmata sp.]|nr:hypothetical protein [Gemmata sp.]
MSRRLLGPVSGAIVFFLIAALVFAGLGWVTFAAIGVERAQREAAARAEMGNNLRVALWRLDGRMLPALGVEDSRPYFHYAPPDPASTPLLGATLPDWMKLHFQLDPISGWSSPQVLDDHAVATAVRDAWADLPVQNLNGFRCAVRDDLREKFPPTAACETFAARDRAIAEDPLPLAAPFFANDSNSVQQSEITQQSLAPPSQPTQQPAGQPVAPSEPVSGTSIPRPDTTAPSFDNCLFDLALMVHCRVNDRLAENRFRLEQQTQNRPGEQNPNQNLGDSRQGNSFNQSNASRGVRGGQKDADGDRAWNSYINRAQLVGKGLQEAKNAAGFPMGRAPNFQNTLGTQNNLDLRNYSNFRDTGNNPTVPSPAGDKTANPDKAPGGVYTDVQTPKIIAGAGGTGGFGPPVVATNEKDLKEY